MKYLNTIVRTLGAPAEYKAGIYLHKKLGDKFSKGDILYSLYSESETKMERAKEMLIAQDFYVKE
jgi:AMP phosphorylase